jgi:integrase
LALGDRSIWSVVERCAKEIGIKNFGARDLRRTYANCMVRRLVASEK